MLYNTLVLPYFNYGILSYHNAPNYALDRLKICQKRAIRAICRLDFNAHTNEHFKEHKLLKFDDIYKPNQCSTVFFQLNDSTTYSICDRLVRNSDIHNYNTRSRDDFIVPYYSRTSSQSCFIYQASTEWNLIPQTVKDCHSTHGFRKKLRKYLLDLY